MNILSIVGWLATFSSFAAGTNVDYSSLAAHAAEEDAPAMVLSEETNGLKSGVWINNSNHLIVIQDGKMIGEASLALVNMSTNDVFFWFFWPSSESGYEIKLVDDRGHIVPKTAYGKRFGRPPSKNPDNLHVENPGMPQRLGLSPSGLSAKGEQFYGGPTFDPVRDIPKCFEIDKLGNYKFIIINHIYVAESRTNGSFLKRITFSPVTVNVRVEKAR